MAQFFSRRLRLDLQVTALAATGSPELYMAPESLGETGENDLGEGEAENIRRKVTHHFKLNLRLCVGKTRSAPTVHSGKQGAPS